MRNSDMDTNKFSCPYCSKLISKSNISYHKKICCSNPNRDSKLRYKTKTCDKCKKSIRSQHFSRHLKVCKSTVDNDNAIVHNEILHSVNEEPVNANQPSTSTSQDSELSHMPVHKKASSEYKILCEKCGKCIRKSNFSYHLQRHLQPELITHRGGLIDNNEDDSTPAKRPRLDSLPKKSAYEKLKDGTTSAIATITNLVKRPFMNLRNEPDILLVRTAFNKCLKVYSGQNSSGIKDPQVFLNHFKNSVVTKTKECLKDCEIKIRLVFFVDYKRGEEIEEFNFKTKYFPIVSTTDILGYYEDAKQKLLKEMEEFQGRGSGWTLHKIDELEIHINRYNPLRASSYMPLPKYIKNKKAIVNVENNDQKCFLWAILSALFPVLKHPERINNYKSHEHDFDDALNGIDLPVKLSDISKFEKKSGVSVNVYACELEKSMKDQEDFEDYPKEQKKVSEEKYDIYPLHITKNELPGRHVNLLYLKGENSNTHYCWIKNMSRLVSKQKSSRKSKIYLCNRCLQSFGKQKLLTEHKKTCKEPEKELKLLSDSDEDLFLCNRCLTKFDNELKLESHRAYCDEHDPVKIVMPEVIKTKNDGDIKPTVSFRNHYRKMKVPFVGYADFECILTPIHSCQPPDTKEAQDGKNEYNVSHTSKYQFHEAASFSLYIVAASDEYNIPFDLYHEYLGSDTAKVFVETITNISKELARLYSRDAAKPMKLTDVDLQKIQCAICCHICEKGFWKKDRKTGKYTEDKVFDHDHLTGKFRGVAHSSCNLNFKKPHFIPIFIHNLSNYDAHLFIRMLGFDKNKIATLATTEERYISFEVKIENGVSLRFLDSFRFMASSLDSLSKNLSKDQFKHTSTCFPSEKLDLVLKKGIFPYDYMDSMDKFEEVTLPAKDAFYNKLNASDVSDKDYEHACNVWKMFNIKNMAEYTLLYNKTDTLLLADIVENFRGVCMDTYKLDPAWYFTSPGLAWDAMLKKTKVQLELLTDPDMELMITKGIRGGLSQCCHRYAKANNRYLHDYDSEKPDEYLIYLDVNNLYGWGMCKYMPLNEFAWCDDRELNVITNKILEKDLISENSKTGYIFEVDLEYPEDLHDTHKDLPLAPENKCPPGSNQRKLLTTLWNKEKYVVHYQNLQLYLSLGMRLTKIHRGIKFAQSPWLKEYIDMNTDMRTKANNDFEKDFYKLMNNSVFGKTMENIRKHVDIRLVTHDKQIEKLVARPNFRSVKIFAETLAAVHMGKTRLYFNKPIYVGMSILDISKIAVYDFHYNVMRVKYGDNARVQYTDTDSLTYNVRTKDLYHDMKTMIDYFDTSDYKEGNPYNMPRVNKKVIGKWKDELAGDVMRQFVGLRSKMYAYDSEGNKSGKKAKGVKKCVVNKELQLDDYKKCLFDCEETYKSMNSNRSKSHNIYSITQHKKALSPYDDKRYICRDGLETLPWGHYRVPVEDVVVRLIDAVLDLE